MLFWLATGIQFLLLQEDDIVTRSNTTMQTMIEKIHSDEVKRNRSRVAEINNLIDHFRDEAESYEVSGPI